MSDEIDDDNTPLQPEDTEDTISAKEKRAAKMNSIKELLSTAKTSYENQLQVYKNPLYVYKSQRDIYYYIILLIVIIIGVSVLSLGWFYSNSLAIILFSASFTLVLIGSLFYYTPKEIRLWKNFLEIRFFLFHSKKISYSNIESCEVENEFNMLGTILYSSSISGGVVVTMPNTSCCSSFVLSPSNPVEFVENVNNLRNSFYLGYSREQS